LIAQGLKAPGFQYRSKKHGLLAQFDQKRTFIRAIGMSALCQSGHR
jgi:predicted RNA-binding protein associated with RNAse of E/G family